MGWKNKLLHNKYLRLSRKQKRIVNRFVSTRLNIFNMRYVAAYMLAVLGGNEAPGVDTLQAIIESVGVGFEEDKAQVVIDKLAGKSINDLIAAGAAQMSSMPAGGAVAAAGGADEAEAPKEEEKKEESEEESDDDMGFGF